MNFVKRKVTIAKRKHSTAAFAQLKQQFLADVVTTVEMEEIPAELILNWDQTGIKIVPSSTWNMDAQGSKRVDVTGVDDKHLITAVFSGSLTGDFLPIQELINLGLPVLRELGAKWLVQMAEYFGGNPQIIVNGFI